MTLCDLAQDPAAYDRQLLRIASFITYGFESFQLGDPGCPSLRDRSSVWVTYGGEVQSGAVYCCPGEGGERIRPKNLVVENVEIPLARDEVFTQFDQLLQRERDTTVRVTLVGRFFAGERQEHDGRTYWMGFGHLGCCSLFAVQRVEGFERHSRRDVDYTAEASWNEEYGCKPRALSYPRHVSIGYDQRVVQDVIEEQRAGDSGERAWAFSDPERVALDALKAIYRGETPTVKEVKKTRTRIVYKWKKGDRLTIIVLNRPYWLSFYAKTTSVIWVATTIKEIDCD